MRTLLVDGDILVYLVGLRNQETASFPHADSGAHVYHTTAREDRCWSDLVQTLHELQERTETTELFVALSDPESSRNWRRAVMPLYKATRNSGARPLIYHRLRERLQEEFAAHWEESLEGDDVLGMWATESAPGECVVASSDKDLQTIPGFLYNWDKHDLGVRTITCDQADYYHMLQTLMGDRTDNYPGCPGMGPVGAKKHLDKHGLSWAAVVKAFEAKGLTEEHALQNARVAHILQAGEFNHKTREVKLWNPTE